MRRRPRVLFITAAFPGAVDPGRANFVAQLARELSGKMDLVLLAPRIHRQDPPRERWAGIDVHRFPFISEGRLLKEYSRLPSLAGVSYLLSGIREAAALAVRHSPDLILTHWVLPAGPIGLAASRLTGAPLVLNAHGSDINVYARQGRLFRSLAQRTLSAAAFTITASDSIRRQVVEDFGVPPGRVEVIPSGIDAAFLDGPPRNVAKKRIGIPQDSRLLLYVGDLTISKGIPVAAKALEKIQEEDPSVWVCLVGRGPEGRRFADRDRVILPGALPNRELPTYFRAADIFLFPSLSEGSPVSVMEALASGLPIVASEVGGVPDLVRDGQTGILVPPGDPARLESAIRSLLDDGSSRRRMAAAAVSRGRDHLAAPRARKVEEVLRRVLRENGADPAAVYDRYWRTTRVDRRDARSRERARAVCRLLGARSNGGAKGRTLLDVGCGRGVAASHLEARGFVVRGVDVSLEAVENARRLGVVADVIDVERDTIRGRYDVITCLEVLEHLANPARVLAKLASSLRPGGRLVVSLPETPPLFVPVLRDAEGHKHSFPRKRARDLFRRAGLRLVGEEALSVAPPRWGALKRVFDAAAAVAPEALAISRVYSLAKRRGRPRP